MIGMQDSKQRLIQLVVLLLGVWAYWNPLLNMWGTWSSNPDYSHGFLVPFICLLILYVRRESRPELTSPASLAGLGLIVLAGVLRYSAGRLYIPELDAWSLPIWIGGWVWLCFGWKYFRWAAPAIGFLFFAMPLPATIEIMLSTPLQKMAAACSAWSLRLIAQPAVADGTVILLDDLQFEVERACSGLRMFFGILALCVATITVARPGLWKSLLLLASVIPVSIIANVARIDVTALLARYWSGEISEAFSHDFAAVVMVPVAAVMFGGVLYILNSISRRYAENQAAAASWGIRWGLAAAVLLVITLVVQNFSEDRAIATIKQTAERYEASALEASERAENAETQELQASAIDAALKNYAKAATYYSRYLNFAHDDIEAALKLAMVKYRSARTDGDRLRAARLYLQAWKLSPAQKEYAVTAIQIALDIQEYRFALDVCNDLQKSEFGNDDSSSGEIDKLRAVAMFEYLNSAHIGTDATWEDAIAVLRRIVDREDYAVWHASVLAFALVDTQSNDKVEAGKSEACQLLQKLVDDKPNEPLAWLTRHRFLTTRGGCDGADADQDLQKALQLVENSNGQDAAQVYRAAAEDCLKREDVKGAENYLSRAIKTKPDSYLPYLILAGLYREQDDENSTDRAIQILSQGHQEIFEKNRRTELALLVPLTSLLVRTKEFEQASQLVSPLAENIDRLSAADRAVVEGTIALVRARIEEQKGLTLQAQESMRPVLQSAAQGDNQVRYPWLYTEMWTFYGDLCSSLDMLDLANLAYRQAIALSPQSELRLQLAHVATQTGDLSLAEEQLHGVVSGAAELKREAYLGLARIELMRQRKLPQSQQNWQAVMTALQKAAENEAPGDIVAQLTIEALLDQGHNDEAFQILEKALKTYENSPPLWRLQAVIKYSQNDLQASQHALNKYRELTPEPWSATLIEAALLNDANRTPEAIQRLEEELDREQSEEGLAQIYVELARSKQREFNQRSDSQNVDENKNSAAREVLDAAHSRFPQNRRIADEAALLAWLRLNDDPDRLKECIGWLKEIEGPDGTIWRGYQTQFLLSKFNKDRESALRQAKQLVEFICERRPSWPKGHFLRGELALSQGELDGALNAYQQAWSLGSRSLLLADRIITIYSNTNREADARKFVADSSNMLTWSPDLFDSAIRYYATGEEQQEALALAQNWVTQRPDDANAQMRLGRVLSLLAESQDGEKKAETLAQAEEAFRKALDGASSDENAWIRMIEFYENSLQQREKALEVLQQLKESPAFSPNQKAFLLARLYSGLGLTTEAIGYLADALERSWAPTDQRSLDILYRCALFYQPRSSKLSERIARHILSIQPDFPNAKFLLANLLIDAGDTAAIEEAGNILETDFANPNEIKSPNVIRAWIRYLLKKGAPRDIDQAQKLSELITRKTLNDKRIQAELYEKMGRDSAAFDLLRDLVDRVTPRPQDQIEYISYWQKHRVAQAAEKEDVPFQTKAQKIYTDLGKAPELIGEFTRWKIREEKIGHTEPNLSAAKIEKLIGAVQSADAVSSAKTSEDQKKLLSLILSAAIQENEPQLAAQLCEQTFADLSPADKSRSLIDALIFNSATAEQQDEFEDLLKDTPQNDIELQQLLADLRFLQGHYTKAAEIYQRILEATPENSSAQNNLALALAESSATIEEAQKLLDEAIKSSPENSRLSDTAATIDLIADNPQRAIEKLEPLADHERDNASTCLHLAEAYRRIGQMEKAELAFQRALALGIENQILSIRDRKWLSELSAAFEYSQEASGIST